MSEKTKEIITSTIVYILFGAFFIWTLLIGYTAFFGGQAPFFFIDFEGTNIVRGLLWLFVAEPIILSILYYVLLVVTLPIVLILMGIATIYEKIRDSRDNKK